MGRRTWTRRRTALAACITACLLVAACGPGVSPVDPAFAAGLLTADGADTYSLTVSNGRVVISAPTRNTGGNTRVAFWRGADAASTDQETCGTWVSYGSLSRQQGAALRLRKSGGRTTAITVTNNVTWGARWGFNIHVMDSGSPEPYHKIGGFILDEVFRPGGEGTTAIPPHPWRMCARAVGSVVSFIVWPLADPQPAWGDPRYGGSVALPAGWDLEGRPGWYIGHLQPGDKAGFEDLTTAAVSSSAASSSQSAGTRVAGPPPRAATWVAEAP